MKFIERDSGGFVEPVPGLEPEAMKRYLPARLQAHPRCAEFLARLSDLAAVVKDMADDSPVLTHAELREQLHAVDDGAHRMQHALQPLASASEAFEALNTQFGYLAMRARERDMPTAGRPVVPALAPDVLDLPDLLKRISTDLQTLRTACAYTTKRIQPVRSAPRAHERWLARATVELFRDCFGKLPPQRSWFADEFMAEIGERMGMPIGHRVVGEVVRAMI